MTMLRCCGFTVQSFEPPITHRCYRRTPMIELSVLVPAAQKQQKGASENKGIFSLILQVKNLQFFHCGFRVSLVLHLYFGFWEKERGFSYLLILFLFGIFALFYYLLSSTRKQVVAAMIHYEYDYQLCNSYGRESPNRGLILVSFDAFGNIEKLRKRAQQC